MKIEPPRPADFVQELHALFVGPPRLTLAVAESVTCGHVQATIGAISGASDFFLGGITAYALAQKVTQLRVDRVDAEKCAAVSPVVAGQMAIGACQLFGSDIAVATTGFAEPAPAWGFPEPGAFWALARSGNGRITVVRHDRCEFPGLDRIAAQQAIARHVITALADFLRITRRAEASARFV